MSGKTIVDAPRADVSLSLFAHQPVKDYAKRQLCPQCKQAYLVNCGPRLFYCMTCSSAVVFQRDDPHAPDALEVVAADALITAAQSVLTERAYWVDEIDQRDRRIADLEAELRRLRSQVGTA